MIAAAYLCHARNHDAGPRSIRARDACRLASFLGKAACTAALTLLLGACSTLPKNVERTPSTAFTHTADTKLGKVAAASAPQGGATTAKIARVSGIRLIGDGEDAFATLFTLIENAQRSLDLQYYIIEDDPYSRALLRAARKAAERGVRVRLLVDDLYTSGKDQRIAWYAAHPNIDVRVFNPFGVGRPWLVTRLAASITDLDRINHRMHNKLFVADNAFAVTGGRNIGAEYYMHSDKTNFLDLDLLVAGPAVKDLSASFDSYWNSAYAYPIEALVKRPRTPRPTVDERAVADPGDPVRKTTAEAREQGLGLQKEIDSGRIALTLAPAEVIVDKPTKVDRTAPEASPAGIEAGATIATDVLSIAKSATRELLIVSPYFVPGPHGMEVIGDLVARGVKVSVLTNSLAATDAAVAHIGYSRYRKALLRLGVELFELRPQPGSEGSNLSALGSSKASLHAKALLVDRHRLFIGSFNVDQRSTLENTEMGLRIESAALSAEVLHLLGERGEEGRYRVQLAPDGHLQWVTRTDGVEQVFDHEPGASPLLKFTLRVLAPFAPDQML